jgi:hypothetical protein
MPTKSTKMQNINRSEIEAFNIIKLTLETADTYLSWKPKVVNEHWHEVIQSIPLRNEVLHGNR